MLENPEILVYMFGSLQNRTACSSESPLQLNISASTSIERVLQQCGIPRDQVQLVMVNHRAVPKETMISPGDRVALFPREYPIFPDWKDYR
ncbi:MAG: MoaD/ThiS family protein [Thermodesulfobacteriota bacterium]